MVEGLTSELLATREQLEIVLGNISEGVTIVAPDGRFVYANAAAARMIGVDTPEELLALGYAAGRGRFDLFRADGSTMPVEELPGRRALAGETPHDVLVRFRPAGGGAERLSMVRAVPVLDERGGIQFVINFFREVTEERQRAAREQFIAETGGVLGMSLDHEAALRAVARLAVPHVADLCTVHLVDEAGALTLVAAEYADPAGAAPAESPPTLDDAHGPGAVVRDGRAEYVAAVTDERLRAVGLRAYLCVPVEARGRVLGAFTLGLTSDRRRFVDEDVEVVEEIARRVAIAIDNALLRRETRLAEQHLHVQHAVARILAESATVEDAIPRALEAIAQLLEWDVGAYWAIAEDGAEARCRFIYVPPGLEAFGDATIDHVARPDVSLVGEIWARAEPRWLQELGERQDFAQAQAAADAGIRTGFGFPATTGGEVVAVLEFFSREVREPDSELLEVVAALGRNIGQFVQRQRHFERAQAARAEAEASAATLRKLARVSEAALEHISLRDLLDALLERITEVLDADTAAILLLDEGRRHLTLRATVGFEEEVALAVPIPLGSGFAGHVAASREPALVDELNRIELVSPVLRARGIKSLVAIPLVVEDEAIGVVHAGSVLPKHFTYDDLRLLELIADRIALAINQSSLHEAERAAQERLAFLGEASALLASALDAETALRRLGNLIVGAAADWCSVHLLDERGRPRLVTISHPDPEKAAAARAFAETTEPRSDAQYGVPKVLRTGRSEVYPVIPPELLEGPVEEAGVHSCVIVPLRARGRTLGALTLVRAETPAPYGPTDVAFAEDLGRRAGVAVDNAELYRQAADRAQAARVLASVGDGVMLVDASGAVRYWNRAAAAITGLDAEDVLDHPVGEAIPGWLAVEDRIPVAGEGATNARAESLPLVLGNRELWLSTTGVEVADGIVYAFRDQTEERALEEMKTEFVSTVSHELRTPLAAIYGAAMTLRRDDVTLAEDQREVLLGVISNEADRLARTVNAILYASRIDTDTLMVAIESCDPFALARDVVDAQRAHLPDGIAVELVSQGPLPRVAADPDKVRQVLVNLVENAVKYSPDGGRVEVRLTAIGAQVRFAVADEGLGIPYAEHRRVFEKFYRLDPNMTRGIGGTGLGLYICREIIRRMNGRISVESEPGRGSRFTFELPIAGAEADVLAHVVA
jgi:signal transduction histidine kinase/putative methionine-R-sulfoxide reductase with GAF domain